MGVFRYVVINGVFCVIIFVVCNILFDELIIVECKDGIVFILCVILYIILKVDIYNYGSCYFIY